MLDNSLFVLYYNLKTRRRKRARVMKLVNMRHSKCRGRKALSVRVRPRAQKNTMPNLQENPTLKDFQKYIEEMVRERGFTDETIPELFMLFLEECGEMAKAARKLEKVKSDPNSKEHLLEEEIADVFIYLLDICNKFNIDLEKAFREKEKINKKRTWK